MKVIDNMARRIFTALAVGFVASGVSTFCRAQSLERPKFVSTGPDESTQELRSPSGKYKASQILHRTDYSYSAIVVEEVASGRRIAAISSGSLSGIAWSKNEDYALIQIFSMRPLTKYANGSYTQLNIVNLRNGNSVDLTALLEKDFKKYFKPLFTLLDREEKQYRATEDPGYAGWASASFIGYTSTSSLSASVRSMGIACNYNVALDAGQILGKNLLPPGSSASKLPGGNVELIERGDVVEEGGIAERHEVFSPEGIRKWIDFHYMVKFGQPLKLRRRVYTGPNEVRIEEMK